MKHRSLLFIVLMTIVTLSIYDTYWLFATRNEMVKEGQDIPSPWITIASLLGLLLVAVAQIIVHFTGLSHSLIQVVNIASVILGILSIIGIVPLTIYWTWKYCKAAQAVTRNELAAGLNFFVGLVLFIFGLWFIWPLIVQSYFNHIAKNNNTPAAAAAT